MIRRIENTIAPQPSGAPISPVTVSTLEAMKALDTPEKDIAVLDNKTSLKPDLDQIVLETVDPNEQPPISEESRKYTKQERQQILLSELQNVRQEADIQVDALATKLMVSQQTIYRDLAELRKNISTDSNQ